MRRGLSNYISFIGKLKSLFILFCRTSLLKTVYVNFKTQKFGSAIKFPIIIGKCVKLRHCGEIILPHDVSFRMLCVGIHHLVVDSNSNISIIENYGKIILQDKNVRIRTGVKIRTDKNATLKIGENVDIGANTVIIANERIELNGNIRISWNCQIMDTNVHYMKNLDTGEIIDKTMPVKIGSYVWIGNHVIINKGVTISDGVVIASNSMVTHSIEECNVVVAGIPTRVVSHNQRIILDPQEELILNQKYNR